MSEHVDKTPTGEIEAVGAPSEGLRLGVDAAQVLSAFSDAVVAADGWNRIVYLNAAAERLFGWPSDELVGGSLTRIIPERFREAHLEGFSRYVTTRKGLILGRPVRLPVLRRDGTEADIDLVLSALVTSDGDDLLVATLRDAADRIDLERQSAVTQQLVRVLAEATTLEATMPRLVEAIGDGLGCDNAQFWVLDDNGGHLRCAQSWERPEQPCPRIADVSRQFTFRRGSGLPGRVWESGAPLWIADLAVDPSFPRLAAAQADGLHSAVAFPIMAAGRLFGVVEAFSRRPMDDDVELMAVMAELGRELGVFIQRQLADEEVAGLLAREQSARAEADVSRRRLSFLAEASAALSSSFDSEATLGAVARLAARRLADGCVMHTLDVDGELQLVAGEHTDPARTDVLRRAFDAAEPDAARPGLVRKTMGTGLPELFATVDDDLLRAVAAGPEQLDALQRLAPRSLMVVPMVARGRTIGAVTLVSTESAHRFDTAELALAEDLARRAALSADNARLYRQQVRVVQALQQSLLPPSLPEIPGIEVAVRYRPCGDQLEVGGDFYDVFRLNDDTWGVVIGDVCGKGAEAAAVTALARYTVRSSALHAARPSRVLGYLNDAMLMHGSDRFCTVAYGRLQLANGGLRLVVGSGGHPLPLVMDGEGRIETLGEYGTLVGPFENPAFSDRSRLLRPGDVVVLYTDGITEACDGGDMLGDEGLEAILAGCVGLSAHEIIDRIERAVMVMEPGARDDIALMVLKVL